MKTIDNCRSCWSGRLVEFLDLGEQYVSDFREDKSKPNKYPLVAVVCEDCFLVQLKHTTPSEEMYHDNYGFKSGVSDSIRADLADIVTHAFQYQNDPDSWLDIGSNDGTLLSFVPGDIYRAGVDPITKYCEEAKQHADKITNDFFHAQKERYDVITTVSCFYDMDAPNQFVSDVADSLAERGVWVIQQNYLLTTMQLRAVDNFCHEHLEYYTLLSLEPLLRRHGLEVIDVSTSMVNGGSLRTVVAFKDRYPISETVEQQRLIELQQVLYEMEPYKVFASEVTQNLDDLKALLDEINAKNQRVAILAASTRGATIWQSAGITEKDVVYAVERNPEKVGKYFSAIGVPIVSEEYFRDDFPTYAIIGPWFFSEEIVRREQDYLARGGKLIQPLPKLQIIG